MTCREIQNVIITSVLDDRAPDYVTKLVNEHVSTCSGCRDFLAAARKLDQKLGVPPAVEPPAYLWDRIRDEIDARPAPLWDGIVVWWQDVLAGFRPLFVRGSLAAAMLVLLVVFVPYLAHQNQAVSTGVMTEISPLAYMDDTNETTLETGVGYGTVAERLL